MNQTNGERTPESYSEYALAEMLEYIEQSIEDMLAETPSWERAALRQRLGDGSQDIDAMRRLAEDTKCTWRAVFQLYLDMLDGKFITDLDKEVALAQRELVFRLSLGREIERGGIEESMRAAGLPAPTLPRIEATFQALAANDTQALERLAMIPELEFYYAVHIKEYLEALTKTGASVPESETGEMVTEIAIENGPEAVRTLAEMQELSLRVNREIMAGIRPVPPIKINGEEVVVIIIGEDTIEWRLNLMIDKVAELAIHGAEKIEIVIDGTTASTIGNQVNKGFYDCDEFARSSFGQELCDELASIHGVIVDFDFEVETTGDSHLNIPKYVVTLFIDKAPLAQ